MTRTQSPDTTAHPWRSASGPPAGDLNPLTKAAILVVSLDEPMAAQLLAHLDRPAVEAVTLEMAHLERVSPAQRQSVLEEFAALLSQRVQFLFDDLIRMDDSQIRHAYHEEDAPLWALALAGSARPLQNKVFTALIGPSASSLRHRLAGLGPYRLNDAEAAQAELAERFRHLHDQGRITLPDPDGQEEIVV